MKKFEIEIEDCDTIYAEILNTTQIIEPHA